MPAASAFDTDVLIIGAGPTGATAALALATYGVSVHMVSRTRWLADTPRAHITNQRAMEVLRDLGVEDEVTRHATPWEQMGDTVFSTSLAGEEIARHRTWGTGEARHGDYVLGSPCPMLDVPQTVMEPILFRNAVERGARFSFSTEYLSHEQDGEGVTVQLRDMPSGREYTMRARYLVGADGARSKVLEDCGLALEGHLARAGTSYVLFRADLSRYTAHRPSILNWVVSPAASFGEIGMGLLRAIRPWDEWIAGWGFDIAKGEPDTSDETVLSQIRTLVGVPNLEIEILRKSLWYVNQAYAPEYAKGRVLCGGDAVHRHPPSSGLGSNTCMQDAHNLAWKLAFVVKGHAGPGLLASYSPERAPVGKQVVLRANQSRLDYAPLRQLLRVEGAENPIAAGIARLRSPGPDGVAARAELDRWLAFKDTEFNAQGTEMNQRYVSAAVLADPDDGEEIWERDPGLYLQATTRPGAKLPHAWLVDRRGLRVSTLDVTGKGKVSLVTGLAGQAWRAAVAALDLPWLRLIVTGEGDTQDPYFSWARIREVEEAGAVLVRPDGYVAWRHKPAVEDPAEAHRLLTTALARILDT
jgi:2,4-dichlorophenol 6-monooxygenase